MVGGDRFVYEVSAASIVAKVYRDRLLLSLTNGDVARAWFDHRGYGTQKHLHEIRTLGAIHGLHRRSFLRKQGGIRWINP